MPTQEIHNPNDFYLRARLPEYVRVIVIGAIIVAIIAVIVGFYRERSKTAFKLRGEHAALSTDVVAEVNNYERLESENGEKKYYIKADVAKTFSDNHQELTNMYLEAFDKSGGPSNTLTAASALYVPGENKDFTAYLKGNVNITTNSLGVKTENVVYTHGTQRAEAEELVEFERDGVKGRSIGAIVNMAEKHIELLSNVEIEGFDSPELAKANIGYAKLSSNSASFDHGQGTIRLDGAVKITIKSNGGVDAKRITELSGTRALATFLAVEGNSPVLKIVEIFEKVHITTTETGQSATVIDAGYAKYDKPADCFELKEGSHIVTSSNGSPTDIRATDVVFEQGSRKVSLTGNAQISQGPDHVAGDAIFANLLLGNKLKDAVVRGNATAKRTTSERSTTVSAPELNVFFEDSGVLRSANAIGTSTAELIPVDGSKYTKVRMDALKGIGLSFRGEGLIEAMRTDGRTTINLSVPNTGTDAADKRVTADTVRTIFSANGKDIVRAEAVGKAQLEVVPHAPSPANYTVTIDAPRFECDFFATGNRARSCTGGTKARAVRVPTVRAAGRGDQTLSADRLTAMFSESTGDIETFEANGSAKFVELDRNAVARQITFARSDEVVRLRGGEPTVWDSRARARAGEIDWDTRRDRSYLRNGVSTTYYNRGQMKEATPFAASDKPVFATSETAEFDHKAETADYRTNARAWQDSNFVRADRLFIDQAAGRFNADGAVQSMLYTAKARQRGASNVPVSVSAGTMRYDRASRVLKYGANVDIRQGTDRLTAREADVLISETGEIIRTVATENVVITQPGRRAAGDWVQYQAVDESAIIRGNPAEVTDSANGTMRGGELTFFLKNERLSSQGASRENPSGRIRTVYKTKPNQ